MYHTIPHKACEFNFVLASKLRECTSVSFPKLLTLQEMRQKHPDWLYRRPNGPDDPDEP